MCECVYVCVGVDICGYVWIYRWGRVSVYALTLHASSTYEAAHVTIVVVVQIYYTSSRVLAPIVIPHLILLYQYAHYTTYMLYTSIDRLVLFTLIVYFI